MRPLIHAILVFLLASCSGGEEELEATSWIEPGQFVVENGRGGLCVKSGAEAAFVIYGEGDANCMAGGAIAMSFDEQLVFKPRGDQNCDIPIEVDGDRIIFGHAGGTCDYYCGDGATLAGKTVRRSESTDPLTDIAGDALC